MRTTCHGCGAKLEPILLLGQALFPPYCAACVAAEQREVHERVVRRLLERAGGGEFRELSLATFPDDEPGKKVKSQAARWLEYFHRHKLSTIDDTAPPHPPPPNLLLYGPVGTGKSGLAWSLVREACLHGTPALFLNFRDYLVDLRQSFRDPSYTVDRRGASVPLLALDDLGAERPTDFAREQLATMIERRLARQQPTIVTSNYDPDELRVRLGHDEIVRGSRIISRLVAKGAIQVRFGGPDRRAEAAA